MTKILLVEDDKSLREIYGVRLLAEGYDIVSAGDGEEALAMAIKERPQLIISDVMMPKISGFDMLDILRSTTETKDIKVIMMTALSSEDQRLRGETLGANRYLVKSQVGIEDVVRTVHEVLEDGQVAAPSASQPYSAPAAVSRPAAPTAVPARPTPQAYPPATPVAPVVSAAAPAPSPTPPAPISSAPVVPPSDTTALPQPTAPFSTTRPANLGDRVIHPIPTPPTTGPDVATLMEKELTNPTAPVQPAGAVAYTDSASPATPVPSAPTTIQVTSGDPVEPQPPATQPPIAPATPAV